MATDQLTIHLTGGTPWGFRLIGGGEDSLMVAKVRQRSKADTAGLKEDDVIMGINNVSCKGISHSESMSLVDNAGQSLTFLILRGNTESHVVQEVFRQLEGVMQTYAEVASSQPVNLESTASTQNHRNLTPFKNPVKSSSPSEMMSSSTSNGLNQLPASQQQYKPPPMFHVTNLTGNKPKPGAWTPSGAIHQQKGLTVSAPSGVQVKSNADQSFTMSFGLDDTASKENQPPPHVAPINAPPLFKVNKVNTESTVQSTWKPSAFNPAPINQNNQTNQLNEQENNQFVEQSEDSLFNQYRQGYMETEDIPALAPDVKVFDLTRILKGEHPDDSDPDSPGFRTRKKMYADSAFYDDPEHKYPTIEEQIKMARNVARSLIAPANSRARGHKMFIKRKIKSDKWVAGQKNMPHDMHIEEEEEKYYRPDPWSNTHTWKPPTIPAAPVPPPPSASAPWEPAPNSWKAPVLPSLSEPEDKPNIMNPNEFEKVRMFDKKSTHDQISPAMCFSLADDLRKMKGKGGALFAKKRANAEKWAVEQQVETPTPNANLMQKILLENAPPSRQDTTDTGPALAGPGHYNGTSSSNNTRGGAPKLQQMIEMNKQACTPWEAAIDHDGNIDAAFDHLNQGSSVYKQLQSGRGGILPRKDVTTGSFAGYSSSSGSVPAEGPKPWAVTPNNKPAGFKPVNFTPPRLPTQELAPQPMVTCGDDGFSDL